MAPVVYCKHAALPFKQVIGFLKELVTDVNIRFLYDYIQITALDPERISILDVQLTNFNQYVCDEETSIGVYIPYLYKLLRHVGKGHEIELAVTDPSELKVVLTDQDKKTETTISIHSNSISNESVSVPRYNYNDVAVLPTADLQRAIREISHVDKRVAVSVANDILSLHSAGNQGSATIAIGPSSSGLLWISRQNTTDFNRTYFVKYIEKFLKGRVSNNVTLGFNCDLPLYVAYEVAEFGYISMAVAAIQD